MSLKELAKQDLKNECVKDPHNSTGGSHDSLKIYQQLGWEMKEEIILLTSQLDEMDRYIEDLSYQNAWLRSRNKSLELLLGDLQIAETQSQQTKCKHRYLFIV